jgi:AcrR family transcriptional regulator
MARSYTLKRRAEHQAETRQRILEAAVALHGSVGPARTSLSMIAERAGVQRNTLYAHFPDERSLAMGCSALHLERHPPPDAAAWASLPAGAARLREGLHTVYGWYRGAADVIACVLRDAEHHELTREISELRFGPPVAAWHEVLGEGLSDPQRALLHLALSFHSWRALATDCGVPDGDAAALMVRAIDTAV